jgi:hypothetical protein
MPRSRTGSPSGRPLGTVCPGPSGRGYGAAAKIRFVGWVWIALLACAVAVLVAAEWPRLSERFGFEGRRQRERKRRKSNLRVLRPEDDDFAASVERDLAQLPTIKERDRNN